MSTELQEQITPEVSRANSRGGLFVSTSLATWTAATQEQFARDCQINDTVYRRLDPEYYVWLRSRMVIAKKAATSGQLPPAAFEALRVRFNAVHEWAVEHFGEAQLVAAAGAFHSGYYKPPVAEDEGPPAPAPHVRKSASDTISPEAIALVDAISEPALSFGWKRERLYGIGSSGILDPRRGLVCFLKPGDRIGEVTLQSIEIIGPPPNGARQHFYNPDVDQPWIIRIDNKEET
jgi:hypothetical protein